MIEKIVLKFGPTPGSPAISIKNPAVTVFVGPNNSGKSQILREISSACLAGTYGGCKILERIYFKSISESQAEMDFESLSTAARLGEVVQSLSAFLNINGTRMHVHKPHYIAARVNPNEEDHRAQHYSQYYASHYTLNMDGISRMQLLNAKPRGDLRYPDNAFSRLLTSDERRGNLRKTIADAVGLHLGIDMSEGDRLHVRFGLTPPVGERTVEEQTLEWMRNAKSIDHVSDGVKAFAGILLELRAGDPKIVLIDEPEAFLHPSLAFKLGREVAKTAHDSGKSVFVSTHSAQFLMGAIQAGVSINIIRLTYGEGVGTARVLSNEDLSLMMKDPLLRSANVLSGLFYENVVVTEADADRAFYQEINERMLEYSPGRGIANALFLNGNGKDTTHRMVAPLRRLGIPAVEILDIDALNLGGQAWTNHLIACSFPPSQYHSISELKATVWRSLKDGSRDPKTSGGIACLVGHDKEAASNLLDSLDLYGLFVLRHGEIERWLPTLDISRNKNWLREIFAALGADPTLSSFVRPSDDDVWAFMDSVATWLKNPERKGIPAS